VRLKFVFQEKFNAKYVSRRAALPKAGSDLRRALWVSTSVDQLLWVNAAR